ncbi:MAG TPA: ATP-binding protein [Vicingus sp.]|nr:ATP-binding protein [Vicingus sp.]
MIKIDRILQPELEKKWNDRKILVVVGPRQVGKTTLLQALCIKNDSNYLFVNGDDSATREILNNISESNLKHFVGASKTIFIDEAQRITNIGLTAKIIYDRFNDVKLLLSGSSALEIANTINEPLTGRKWEYNLYPISWEEYVNFKGYLNARLDLNTRLIYGMYPEVVTNPTNSQQLLSSIAGSYLYKDLLQYQGIRKPEILEKILIALALQLGSEVNYNELANTLRIDRATVEQYINLLEKTYVIFKLNPFSRNLRNELSSGRKIYFYDNGIRNALIGDFKPVELRQDIGQLWENFCVSERIKQHSYKQWYGKHYFWRTYQQQEIDLIEEIDGKISTYEFKWNVNKKGGIPKTFANNYEVENELIVTPENFYASFLNL